MTAGIAGMLAAGGTGEPREPGTGGAPAAVDVLTGIAVIRAAVDVLATVRAHARRPGNQGTAGTGNQSRPGDVAAGIVGILAAVRAGLDGIERAR